MRRHSSRSFHGFFFKRIKPTGDNLVRYSAKGDLKAVKYLLDKGVHPDTKNSKNEKALDSASRNGHWKIARLLVAITIIKDGCRPDR